MYKMTIISISLLSLPVIASMKVEKTVSHYPVFTLSEINTLTIDHLLKTEQKLKKKANPPNRKHQAPVRLELVCRKKKSSYVCQTIDLSILVN